MTDNEYLRYVVALPVEVQADPAKRAQVEDALQQLANTLQEEDFWADNLPGFAVDGIDVSATGAAAVIEGWETCADPECDHLLIAHDENGCNHALPRADWCENKDDPTVYCHCTVPEGKGQG